MQQTTSSPKINYAEVGQAISHELAAKMVKDFSDANPHQHYSYNVGRNIIEQILAQPGCVGLKIWNAIDNGKYTLVYAGIDKNGNVIFEFPAVGVDGKLGSVEALIGDKLDQSFLWSN